MFSKKLNISLHCAYNIASSFICDPDETQINVKKPLDHN